MGTSTIAQIPAPGSSEPQGRGALRPHGRHGPRVHLGCLRAPQRGRGALPGEQLPAPPNEGSWLLGGLKSLWEEAAPTRPPILGREKPGVPDSAAHRVPGLLGLGPSERQRRWPLHHPKTEIETRLNDKTQADNFTPRVNLTCQNHLSTISVYASPKYFPAFFTREWIKKKGMKETNNKTNLLLFKLIFKKK